jgi:hypothetical protein
MHFDTPFGAGWPTGCCACKPETLAFKNRPEVIGVASILFCVKREPVAGLNKCDSEKDGRI